MLRILVVDDHPVVRQGLKYILSGEPRIEMVGEASNSQEALNLIRTSPWDAVILDIAMPGRGGLDILKELKRDFPKLPVLILSMHPEEQYAMRALKEGAAGYMNKESAPYDLLTAIKKITRGGKYISPALSEKLLFAIDTEKPLHENLSNREFQVMLMIASGKGISRIADEMSLSVKTVGTYRTRILDKLNVANNAEIMRYAMQHKLIE